ncbi:pro-sigmaK processing inhibitor BofA family protein [Microaceticoccus formicicus]|uniref:pro-sigmaK processing inhibitor BofA family protein n=1 Tax=Microaceticoccus formicicus TaxID=3118105 RepID=UPI003CD021E0|nr:pro-sigmaK processing inhibitor BofA family protein [Peptoniphilaceae bacterium AMB_02]
MEIIAAIIGIVLMLIIAKVLSVSMKIILKLLLNSLVGVGLLLVFNLLAGFFSLSIEFNFINALVAGFLGFPGIILLLLLNR